MSNRTNSSRNLSSGHGSNRSASMRSTGQIDEESLTSHFGADPNVDVTKVEGAAADAGSDDSSATSNTENSFDLEDVMDPEAGTTSSATTRSTRNNNGGGGPGSTHSPVLLADEKPNYYPGSSVRFAEERAPYLPHPTKEEMMMVPLPLVARKKMWQSKWFWIIVVLVALIFTAVGFGIGYVMAPTDSSDVSSSRTTTTTVITGLEDAVITTSAPTDTVIEDVVESPTFSPTVVMPTVSTSEPTTGAVTEPTTSEPAPTTSEPAPTTAEPAPTTSEPAPTTAVPAPTTAEPAPTTVAPAPTTSEPAPTTAALAPPPQLEGGCNGIPHSQAIHKRENAYVVGMFGGSSRCRNPGPFCTETPWESFKNYTGTVSTWFIATAMEDSFCHADIEHRVKLTVPVGVNYDLHVYMGNDEEPYELPVLIDAGENFTEEVIISNYDQVSRYNSFTYYIQVEYKSGSSCQPWTLEIFGHVCPLI